MLMIRARPVPAFFSALSPLFPRSSSLFLLSFFSSALLPLSFRSHRRSGATLPNLIVYIDLRDGEPTGPSLFAVSEARRIAHAAGLSVFALCMSEPAAASAPTLAARLGPAGADRVLICEGAGLGAPPLDVTHGRALMSAVERIPPIIVLFPPGGPGDELGPSLASRMGAAFGPGVDVEVSAEPGPLADGVGRVRLCRWRADRAGVRSLDPVEIERPVVAILGAHGTPAPIGTPDIDVDVIACAAVPHPPVVELGSEPDDMAALALARALVVVADGAAEARVAELRAAVPADVAVVYAPAGAERAKLAAALSASSPELVLDVGGAALAAEVAISPRTRLGRVALDGLPPAPDALRVAPDALWPAPATDGTWRALAAALEAAAPRGGGKGGAP